MLKTAPQKSPATRSGDSCGALRRDRYGFGVVGDCSASGVACVSGLGASDGSSGEGAGFNCAGGVGAGLVWSITGAMVRGLPWPVVVGVGFETVVTGSVM